MNLEYLRLLVSNKEPKMKQTHIVLLCLNFVEQHPEYVSTVGCCWDSNNTFMINSAIFGKFIERDPNTINRNFRTHGFTQTKSSSRMRENVPKKFRFNNIPDPPKWYQRQGPHFTKQTKVADACAMEYHKLIPKKHIKKNTVNEEGNIFDEFFVPYDQFDENGSIWQNELFNDDYFIGMF